MNVLVTGAGGFIGTHLVSDQLKRGRNVTAVDLNLETLTSISDHPRLNFLQCDFMDHALIEPHLENIDICFHLASVHLEIGVAEGYFWAVNVGGAKDFVERCHRAGVGRFVHCSSVGVYGSLKNPPANEFSICHPETEYERSKLAGEMEVNEYAQENGYPVVVIRPAWVYGPGCPRTRKLFRAIKKGRFFFVGDGQSLRHPIYIDDMLEAFEVAATNPRALGEMFIIAGPRAVTLRELASEIANSLGVPPPSLRLPKTLVWTGLILLEVTAQVVKREAPYSRRSLKFYTGNTSFDTRKATEDLGFYPKISLEEGVRRTYEWMSEVGYL
jgi:nucleoside-diphosphate-sugar epimerase